MRWFGESWGAPVCEVSEHVPVPQGEICAHCRRPIKAHHQGFLLPCLGDGLPLEVPYHRNCMMGLLGLATVHHLVEGGAVCGFWRGVFPGDWPRGHLWTNDPADVTCVGCAAVRANARPGVD